MTQDTAKCQDHQLYTDISAWITDAKVCPCLSGRVIMARGALLYRWNTRGVKYYGGLTHTMPIFIIIFLFCTTANLGLHGTFSFGGDCILLVSAFEANTASCFFAATSMFFGGVYSGIRVSFDPFGNICRHNNQYAP